MKPGVDLELEKSKKCNDEDKLPQSTENSFLCYSQNKVKINSNRRDTKRLRQLVDETKNKLLPNKHLWGMSLSSHKKSGRVDGRPSTENSFVRYSQNKVKRNDNRRDTKRLRQLVDEAENKLLPNKHLWGISLSSHKASGRVEGRPGRHRLFGMLNGASKLTWPFDKKHSGENVERPLASKPAINRLRHTPAELGEY